MDNRQGRLSCMRKSVEWLRLVGSVKRLFLLKQNSIKFHLYSQVYTIDLRPNTFYSHVVCSSIPAKNKSERQKSYDFSEEPNIIR